MNHKLKTAMVLSAAAAAGYSFLPSAAAKYKRAILRKTGQREERLRGTPKILYLTFDDGPHPVYTEKLLNLLEKYQIKATFFVVGKFAEENPQIIMRMKKEGHRIGLHSYDHKSAMIQSPKESAKDFRQCVSVMKKLHIDTNLYRPPWGHVNWITLRQLSAAGMRKILWDVMAQDWEPDTDEETIQYKLLKRAQAGDIICLHDRQADSDESGLPAESGEKMLPPARMIAALEKTIPIWLEEGYVFETIR